MTGGETITAWLALGLAVAWVLWYVGGPLRRSRLGPGRPGMSPGEAVDGGLPEPELPSVLTALRELERDRELGLLSAAEYAPLRARHEARALVLYREMDEVVERRRAAVAAAVAAEKAALVAASRAFAAPVPAGERRRADQRHAAHRAGHALAEARVPAGPHLPEGEGGSEGLPAVPGPAFSSRRDATARPHAGRALTRSQSEPDQTRRRGRVVVLASTAAAVLFLAGVGALWYTGPVGRGAQRPIATVAAPDYHVLAFDPASPGRAFLGTHAGLFVSSDRGQGWRPVPSAGGDVMAVVPVPQPEGTRLLAAGHDVFMRSVDGSSWQPVEAGLPGTDVHALAASPAVPSRLYAAVVGHGMFRSDDAGRSWNRTGQMPASIAALAVVPEGEGDLLFAATAQEGVLASRDGGRSWGHASGSVNGALPTRQVTAIAYDGRSGDVSGAFRGALFVATDRGVFRSTDGGSSWARLGLEAEVAALTIAPDDPRTLLAVDTNGRVYRSTDRGVSW